MHYYVMFDAYINEAVNPKTQKVSEPSKPTNSCYTFNRWYIKSGEL